MNHSSDDCAKNRKALMQPLGRVEQNGGGAYNRHNTDNSAGGSVTTASEVILYTHPDCAFSAAAKMDYRKRKIAYEDVDLSKQEDRIPELLALTNGERVTPVIVENGAVTIGFKGGT